VQAYAPELNKRRRPHLKRTNKSYRIDEIYINVKGEDKYLYRALDSTGQTIDFLLTPTRYRRSQTLSPQGRTLQGIETVNMIRKGREGRDCAAVIRQFPNRVSV
jgi:DDE domain